MKIGGGIYRRRKKLGINAGKLGVRDGLTAGFLNRVKNDQVFPSLHSRQGMAAALQVPTI